MASQLKILGVEQTFTSPNTFSSSNSTMVSGYNAVRVINTNTSPQVITVLYSTGNANCTIGPGQEMIIKKPCNTAINASSASILGTLVAFENN